jgi:predicted transcriptional regulator
MSNVVIISIKPEYSSEILSGSKTIELRRSTLGLSRNDIVIVYESAPKQALGFWFRVAKVEVLSIDEMWTTYGNRLGIDHESYLAYFNDCPQATGLHVGEVHRLNPAIPLARIKEVVPDFMPPQGVLFVRDNNGRFKKLLSMISPALPDDTFQQLPLFSESA